MADKLMRAQVTLPSLTGLAEDAATNTWHFDGDDLGSPITDTGYHDTVVDLLTAFYQSIDNGVLSDLIDGPLTVKIYDMRDALPRVPERIDTITITPRSSQTDRCPTECAIALSFSAGVASGQVAARRRGRIYLGPVDPQAFDSVSGRVVVDSTTRTLITGAAATLMAGADTSFGSHVSWAIYSPTTDVGSSVDDAFNDVVSGWVDDAPDTQRRRGTAPTVRTTF